MSKNEHNERPSTYLIRTFLLSHQWWDITTGWWCYCISSDENMRNERLKIYLLRRLSDKKIGEGKHYWKIIINMSMDILRATKLKYGAIHSADPKPMWEYLYF